MGSIALRSSAEVVDFVLYKVTFATIPNKRSSNESCRLVLTTELS
jgi:hypothetical protein